MFTHYFPLPEIIIHVHVLNHKSTRYDHQDYWLDVYGGLGVKNNMNRGKRIVFAVKLILKIPSSVMVIEIIIFRNTAGLQGVGSS